MTRKRLQATLLGLSPFVLIATTGGHAEEVTQDRAWALEPMTVTAPRLVRDQQETPAAVSVVDEQSLQSGRQNLQLDESLNQVPGVFFQNRYNFAQNLRLSMRGFGARAPFGVRGIRLRVDGFPETLPDGQSQVDTIDLEAAERVEVLRGPTSSLYGNAAGGVVDVTTRSGPDEGYVQGRAAAGSYGYRRVGAMGGGTEGDWRGHASAWHMRMDGYRDHSATEKMMFNGKASYQLSPGRELTTVFTAYDQPKGQDPGGLKREEVREDRRQAADNAELLDSGQEVEQQRLGLILTDENLLPGELTGRVFYTRREFAQQLPFPGSSDLAYSRDFYGLGMEYQDGQLVGAFPVDYTVGLEAAEQRDDRERFLNFGDGRAGQTQDALETGTSAGVYGQVDVGLTERVDFTLGGRFDRVRLKVRDRLFDGEGSGRQSFNEATFNAGPTIAISPRHNLYASVGTGFESPTFTEFYDPSEGDEPPPFDEDLSPQRSLSTEVGMKGQLGERTRYDLAVFRVNTDDEIVQFESDPDRFRNAGETRRDGVELGVEHFLTERLSLQGAYTWSDFRFRDYEDDLEGVNYRDNRLPGLPEHNLFAELAWQDPGGSFVALDTLVVSNVYADDANEERVSGYGLVNLRSGVTQQFGDREMEWFWGLNNLLDRQYPSNIRINDTNDRFFEPAPERNIHAGVRLTF